MHLTQKKKSNTKQRANDHRKNIKIWFSCCLALTSATVKPRAGQTVIVAP